MATMRSWSPALGAIRTVKCLRSYNTQYLWLNPSVNALETGDYSRQELLNVLSYHLCPRLCDAHRYYLDDPLYAAAQSSIPSTYYAGLSGLGFFRALCIPLRAFYVQIRTITS